MSSYAIIEACGKQYWVEEKKFYDFDKLPLNVGDTFNLNRILLVKEQDSEFIGKPYLDSNYNIEAVVLRHISGPKVRVYKMRPKKKTRRTFGHRRKATRILVNNIQQKTTSNISCII